MNPILRLKEFYLLEMFQLTVYESQMASLQNEYIEHAYQRIIIKKPYSNTAKKYLFFLVV